MPPLSEAGRLNVWKGRRGREKKERKGRRGCEKRRERDKREGREEREQTGSKDARKQGEERIDLCVPLGTNFGRMQN